MAEEESGLLWVSTRVPSDTWREAWGELPKNAGFLELIQQDTPDPSELWTSFVQAVDPETGSVIKTRDLPGYVIDAMPRQTFAVYSLDGIGIPRVLILRFHLVR